MSHAERHAKLLLQQALHGCCGGIWVLLVVLFQPFPHGSAQFRRMPMPTFPQSFISRFLGKPC
jgi:hypothetical protein